MRCHACSWVRSSCRVIRTSGSMMAGLTSFLANQGHKVRKIVVMGVMRMVVAHVGVAILCMGVAARVLGMAMMLVLAGMFSCCRRRSCCLA